MRHPWRFLAIALLIAAFAPQTHGYAARFQPKSAPLSGVTAVAEGAKTRVYIRAAAADEGQVIDMRRRLMSAGARNVNLFLPYKILVCEIPESMDLLALIDDPRVDVIEESRLNPGRVADGGSGLELVRRCYQIIEQHRFVDAAPMGGSPGDFRDAVLTVPREVVRASKDRARLSTVAGGVQERSIEQNSEFLAGDILMQVILPESDGHGEDWTEQAIASALQGALTAGIAYQQMFHSVSMHFVFAPQKQVPTPHEPIQTGMDDHPVWIADLMEELGIPVMEFPSLMVHEYNNRGRQYYQTDWAFTAFVASSENALNHRFADQWYTAYANLGGPYMVIPFPAGENPFAIDPVLVYSTVFQHEMSHVFWALDEYPGEFNMAQCNSRTGYLNYSNDNKVTELLDGTYEHCPGVESIDCIMWKAKEDLGRPVCRFTQGQIGVIDNNRNDIPDVYDAAPTVEFETAAAETVETPDITINMTAVSLPVLNRNPRQGPDERMSYAPRLRNASLTVNGVGPVNIKPLDGTWDDVEEDLSLVLNGLPVGMTQVAVTVRNVAGKASDPIVKNIFFVGIKYALFDVLVKEKGIYLSWNTIGDSFGARLDLHRIDTSSGIPDTTVLATDIQPENEQNLYRFFEFLDSNVKPGYEYGYFVRGYFSIEYTDTTIEYHADSGTFSARSMFPINTGSLTSYVSPNPFNESTNISVRIPSSFSSGQNGQGSSSYAASAPVQTDVTMTVYDVAGRFVKEIYRGRQFGGVQTFAWDGTNAANQRVPSGIYFIKTVAGSATEVKKVVTVR